MKEEILQAFKESAEVKTRFIRGQADILLQVVKVLVAAFKGGHKVLLFGNGGSAADAQHLAAEFVNRFLIERPPLPAIALTTDTSILTSIGNDYGYADTFAKQVKALGKTGDVAIGISTTGTAANVVKALKTARDLGLKTVAMTGGNRHPRRSYMSLKRRGRRPKLQASSRFWLVTMKWSDGPP